MLSLNRVELIGHLGANPEFGVTTTSRKEVCNLSIATSEVYFERLPDGSKGEKKEKTTWTRLTIWNPRQVELAKKYLAKGDYLRIVAKLESRSYEKDGETRYTTDVIVKEIGFLSPRKDQPERIGGDEGNDIPF